jgi:hypothetical protein
MEMDGNQKFDPPGCEELDMPISVGVDHPTTPDVAEAVAHGMATPTSTAHTDVSLDFVRCVSATRVSAVGVKGVRAVCTYVCAWCTCVFATCEKEASRDTSWARRGAASDLFCSSYAARSSVPLAWASHGEPGVQDMHRIWDNHAVTYCSESGGLSCMERLFTPH